MARFVPCKYGGFKAGFAERSRVARGFGQFLRDFPRTPCETFPMNYLYWAVVAFGFVCAFVGSLSGLEHLAPEARVIQVVRTVLTNILDVDAR